MDVACLFIPVVRNIRANSKKAKFTAKVFASILMEVVMKAIGQVVIQKEKEQNHSKMVLN